ncbi:MAG: hypothetical protein V1867_03125, partial [Candidatus Falkowbacteria bacterium]
MNNDKNIAINQNHIPWYFGRKFWGILTALPFLLSFLFYWHNTYDPFWEKLNNYFSYLASGFYSILDSLLGSIYKNGIIKWNIILYYII